MPSPSIRPIAPSARRWRAALLAAFVLPAANCTCANVAYTRAYAGAIEAQCDAYRHRGGPTAVRDDAAQVLAAQGFALDPVRSGPSRLETGWREEDEARARIIVELDDDGAGTRVRATRSDETLSPPRYEPQGDEPAPELEAELVRRLVPARAGEKDEALAGHVFELPARVLLAEAEGVLTERGEGLELRDEGAQVRTAWRETVDGRSRVLVGVVELDATHRRVEARRERERVVPGSRLWQPGPSRRDLEFELTLVDRRDPTGAATIRERAEAEARAAYESAIEHGAPSCGL